jgi:hypothetical protein
LFLSEHQQCLRQVWFDTSQDPSPRMALVDFFFGKVKTLLYANPTWGTLGGRDMNIIK